MDRGRFRRYPNIRFADDVGGMQDAIPLQDKETGMQLSWGQMIRFGCLVTLLGLAGCPEATESRLTNQGGGSLISAGLKAAQNDFCGLTADEWQILADNAPSLAQQYGIQINFDIPELTDEQAEGIVNYVNSHGLCTIDAIKNAAETTTEVPPELAALFQ